MIIIRVIKKYVQFLDERQKKEIKKLSMLMVIGGFLEMFSVSLMIPFIQAVMNPDIIMNNNYIQIICNVFSIDSYRMVLVLISLGLMAAYFVKNAYLVYQTKVQYKFVTNNMFAFRVKLLKSYLKRPYEFFLTANSGEIIRIIQDDTAQAFNLLTSLLSFFSEIVVSIALVITIFIISPVITISMAGILVVVVCIIFIVVQPLLSEAGEKYQESTTSMNQSLIQSIQGIKEVKIMRKEGFFADIFYDNCVKAARSRYQYVTISVIPRFLIEAASLGAFFLVVSVLIYNGADLVSLIPMLSAVAMAAIRLLPAANRISQCASEIAYGEPMLDKAMENLTVSQEVKNECLKENKCERMRFDHTICMENITYRYPSGKTNILENANIIIKKGESIGFIGKSGAGKTTTVDILLGLLNPKSGNVYVDGICITENINAWNAIISYIPQNIFMIDGNIKENVAFGEPGKDIDEKRVMDALGEASLKGYVEGLPDGIETQIGERGIRISGGQKQRIGIARALYNNPSILVFDEATSALDNETEKSIMESINLLHGKKTMIIIAHRLTTIEGCDHIYRVEGRQIHKLR